MGLFDYIFNVVRDFNDFLHILVYLIISVCAFIYGVYKSDKELYKQYIYDPFNNIILRRWRNFFNNTLQSFFTYIKTLFILFAPKSLRLASNRLPYYIIAIRNKSKIVFTKINDTILKIKELFNFKK